MEMSVQHAKETGLKLMLEFSNAFETKTVFELYKAIVDEFPDYIWVVPASSTGKYHPAQDAGVGGLIRHMTCVGYFMCEMLNLEQYKQLFSPIQRDCMRVAALVHDGRKNGPAEVDFNNTQHAHPNFMADAVLSMRNIGIESEDECKRYISTLIRTHSGQWNTSKYSAIVLDKPVSIDQELVHLADYLASRKPMTLDIDNIDFANLRR